MNDSHCVLVVDDDPDIREVLEILLEGHGYRVITAADGVRALERIRGGDRPCVILLDFMMPRMNGMQFRAVQVREPTIADLPVVVLSGDSNAVHTASGLGLEVLTKPVTSEMVLATVRRYCPGSRSSNEARP